MQKTERYNWETWFDTADGIMCHKFSERVEIHSDIKTGVIRIFKDGCIVNRIDGSDMPVKEYESLLLRTAKEAMTLQTIINK